jgi:hypothetical protein
LNQKKETLKDVFDETVKFSDKMPSEGGQKINRKPDFVQNPKIIFQKSCVSKYFKTFVPRLFDL